MSIAACAIPRNVRPSLTRGVGTCRRGAAVASVGGSSAISWRKPASASRASPSVPETQMSSPACAASRLNARSGGTSPNTVMQIFSGPLVVSPPISSQSCASASANRPREKPSRNPASARGSASASVKASGLAPQAARSLRFTASALWPSRSGATVARKCRPSTSMSLETASCIPADGASSAQSSPTPSAARFTSRLK